MAVDEMDSYQRLSRQSRFHNEDERLWWHSTAPMFSKLLETAKYDKAAQLGHLETFKKLIIPCLGVYPTQHGTRWLSVLTRHGLPFELSLNCSNSIVRYTYEPINQETATKEDLFNTKAIWPSLSLLKEMQPSIDLQWFTHFKKDLTLSEEESAIVGAGDISQYPIKTQNKLALDLKQNCFTVKCYIYPELKAIATGTSVQDLMFNSIQSLCKATPSIGPAFNALQEYIESHNTIAAAQDGTSLSPRLLSCDLVNPERSRIKVYVLQRMVS